MDDGKKWDVTQLEISIDDIDIRDFHDVYQKLWPRTVCGGEGLLVYIPMSPRHMIEDRPKKIEDNATANDRRAITYKTMGTSILNEENGVQYRPILFLFGNMTCSGNLKSQLYPTKDQAVKLYIDPVDTQIKREGHVYESKHQIGYIRLNIVSEKPKSLEVGNKIEHSLQDAMKGCD